MGVGAAGDQAVVIQHLADFGRGKVPVAREFDAFKTDRADGLKRSGKIFFTLLAHGIKLDAQGDFFGVGEGRPRERKANRGRRRAGRAAPEKFTPGQLGTRRYVHPECLTPKMENAQLYFSSGFRRPGALFPSNSRISA